jgi:hypothetical protein
VQFDGIVVVSRINSPPGLVQNFGLGAVQFGDAEDAIKLLVQPLWVAFGKLFGEHLEVVGSIVGQVKTGNEVAAQP